MHIACTVKLNSNRTRFFTKFNIITHAFGFTAICWRTFPFKHWNITIKSYPTAFSYTIHCSRFIKYNYCFGEYWTLAFINNLKFLIITTHYNSERHGRLFQCDISSTISWKCQWLHFERLSIHGRYIIRCIIIYTIRLLKSTEPLPTRKRALYKRLVNTKYEIRIFLLSLNQNKLIIVIKSKRIGNYYYSTWSNWRCLDIK